MTVVPLDYSICQPANLWWKERTSQANHHEHSSKKSDTSSKKSLRLVLQDVCRTRPRYLRRGQLPGCDCLWRPSRGQSGGGRQWVMLMTLVLCRPQLMCVPLSQFYPPKSLKSNKKKSNRKRLIDKAKCYYKESKHFYKFKFIKLKSYRKLSLICWRKKNWKKKKFSVA